MRQHSHAALVAGVLGAILVFHLCVAWQGFPTLARNGFLYDDSFYAFKIAENIAAGRGVSFDGVHKTTGFQPLYVFLLVPLYAVSHGNAIAPIYLALSLLALFTVLTAFVLYRIARRYVGEGASFTAAAIWAMSPIVVKQGANGLETAIAAFMIAVSVMYYLEKVRPEDRPPAGRLAALGALLGVTVLARIDGALLVLVMLLDYLVTLRRRKAPGRVAVRVALVPAVTLLFYGPWLLCNLRACGTPFQDSGAATRLLSLAYAGYFGYGAGSLAAKGPDPSLIWAHVSHAAATMKVIPPVHVLFRSLERLGAAIGMPGAMNLAANAAGLAALALSGIVAWRWRRDPRTAARREIDFLVLFSAALVAAYSTYVFGMFFFLRYFYPVYLVACLYTAFIVQDLFDWHARRSPAFKRFAVAAAAAYAIVFGCFSCSQSFRSRPVYPYYDIARWVDAHTAPGERIGVFQCGTIGYLCHRDVVNLDGKVNREAFEAMKSGRLDRYIETEGIDVVLDHARILEIFLGNIRENGAGTCTEVRCAGLADAPGWVAYRRSNGAGTAGAVGGGGWLHAAP